MRAQPEDAVVASMTRMKRGASQLEGVTEQGGKSWPPQTGRPFPCFVLLSQIEFSSEQDPGPCLILKSGEDK